MAKLLITPSSIRAEASVPDQGSKRRLYMNVRITFRLLFLAVLLPWHAVHAVEKPQFSPGVSKNAENAIYTVRLLTVGEEVIGAELRWMNRGGTNVLLEWPLSGCTIDMAVVIDQKDFKRPRQKFVLPDGVFRTSKGIPTSVLNPGQNASFFVKLGSAVDARHLPPGKSDCVVRVRLTVYVKGMTPKGIDIPIPTVTFKKCSVSRGALELDADRLYENALIDEAAK